jgi:glutathione S-transferase
MKLYTCARSRGLRVTWAAEELGLPLDLQMLPFPPRKRAPEYLAQNPLGTVPMLVDGETVMTESSAIVLYLAERAGNTPLNIAPGEPDRAALLDYLHHADATLTFPQTVYMRYALFEQKRGLQEAGALYADWFAARLVKIETRLSTREYLCAGRFTIADIAVGYALYLTTMNGLSERLTPNARAYLDRLTARDGFKRALVREDEAATAQGAA